MATDDPSQPPLEIRLDGDYMNLTLKHRDQDGSFAFNDRFRLDLAGSPLRRQPGESDHGYILRVREALVRYTPNADPTPETLR